MHTHTLKEWVRIGPRLAGVECIILAFHTSLSIFPPKSLHTCFFTYSVKIHTHVTHTVVGQRLRGGGSKVGGKKRQNKAVSQLAHSTPSACCNEERPSKTFLKWKSVGRDFEMISQNVSCSYWTFISLLSIYWFVISRIWTIHIFIQVQVGAYLDSYFPWQIINASATLTKKERHKKTPKILKINVSNKWLYVSRVHREPL